MNTVMWKQILGNTWCMEGGLSIPVYYLNDREVVLLDSGYAHRERTILDQLLQEKKLRVRAIIGSHSHSDHSGNHRYYQETHGAEIILRDVEAAIVSDFSLMTLAYGPSMAAELEREMPQLLLKADRVFSREEEAIDIDGAIFGLFPLPGHTTGHTGIITPDQVLYVGDAVLSYKEMQAVKLPATMNWQQDLESKKKLLESNYPAYILAHSGVYNNICALVKDNITDKLQRAEIILQLLQSRESWILNEVEMLLWEQLGLHSSRFITQVCFRRNVRCVMNYLVSEGMVATHVEKGCVWFSCAPF